MPINIFIADAVFMGLKYLIETAFLCFMLALCLLRKPKRSFQLLWKAAWLILLSAAVQIVTHYLFDRYFPLFSFMYRYLIWNILTMCIFHMLYLRKLPYLSLTFISFLLVSDSFCQILATYIIYGWKSYILVVTEFKTVEQLVSTGIIWSLFLLCCWLILWFSRGIYEVRPKEACFFSAFSWLFFLACNLLGKFFLKSQTFPRVTAIVHFLFLVELCFFYVIAMLMLRERKIATEQTRLIQLYTLQLQHADELNYLYQDFLRTRHEMKNQLLYMEHLLEEQRYGELKTYFSRQRRDALSSSPMINCGNALVNAILWSKQQTAERLNIPMSFDASLPQEISIQGHHLCSVLVNLLDNAIEGSVSVPDPGIHVILRVQQNYIFCCVSNRIKTDVLKANPELQTTKKDALNHGFGIRSIKMIAELYNGMTEFTVEDGEFIATVMLLCE